jgi:hypothetical protein
MSSRFRRQLDPPGFQKPARAGSPTARDPGIEPERGFARTSGGRGRDDRPVTGADCKTRGTPSTTAGRTKRKWPTPTPHCRSRVGATAASCWRPPAANKRAIAFRTTNECLTTPFGLTVRSRVLILRSTSEISVGPLCRNAWTNSSRPPPRRAIGRSCGCPTIRVALPRPAPPCSG